MTRCWIATCITCVRRVGKVRRVYSNWVAKGLVVGQKPHFGSQLPRGTRVDLVVSKGQWR